MKRLSFGICFFVFAAAQAYAMTADEKQCVVTSAQKLPKIMGAEIIESRASPTKLDPGVQTTLTLIDIELDVKAAGIAQTYMFLCFFEAGGGIYLAEGRGVK